MPFILFIQVAALYTVLVALTLEINKKISWWILAGCVCIIGFLIGIICIIPVRGSCNFCNLITVYFAQSANNLY